MNTVLCSGNGSSFIGAYDVLVQSGLKPLVNVLSTSDNELSRSCRQRGIRYEFISYADKDEFTLSLEAKLNENESERLHLFFDKYIQPRIFHQFVTINYHPSILPAFPGMNSVKKAFDSKVSEIGATSHFATNQIDAGPVITQVKSKIQNEWALSTYEKLSYFQKIYLLLMNLVNLPTINRLNSYYPVSGLNLQTTQELNNESVLRNFKDFSIDYLGLVNTKKF